MRRRSSRGRGGGRGGRAIGSLPGRLVDDLNAPSDLDEEDGALEAQFVVPHSIAKCVNADPGLQKEKLGIKTRKLLARSLFVMTEAQRALDPTETAKVHERPQYVAPLVKEPLSRKLAHQALTDMIFQLGKAIRVGEFHLPNLVTLYIFKHILTS
jgi:hypothetical protein